MKHWYDDEDHYSGGRDNDEYYTAECDYCEKRTEHDVCTDECTQCDMLSRLLAMMLFGMAMTQVELVFFIILMRMLVVFHELMLSMMMDHLSLLPSFCFSRLFRRHPIPVGHRSF